jgi:cobaltochelatase CobS
MEGVEKKIKELEDLVLKSTDDNVRKIAQGQLDMIKQRQKINVDKDFSGVITAINSLIEKVYNSSTAMSSKQIDDVIAERLKKLKINQENLSKELKELIGQTKTTVIQINEVRASSSKGTKGRRLEDILLSDAEAQNNVYLFGEAGTGKTFIAGTIADKLNYKLITLNCNQFTSPLDIVGGQTIEGYKEGRLTQAWGNLDLGLNPLGNPYEGALLLLDELPKIDPNTAGILNDGLAKIKDGIKEITDSNGNKVQVMPTIMNGNGELISKKRIFVIATGNSLLNEANKDYEANFKQDLSLQDRFVGSTYELFVNLKTERKLMLGYLFIFNFMNKVRKIIESTEGKAKQLGSKGFVSIRVMQSLRDSFRYWYANHDKSIGVKTLTQGINSFWSLFTPSQQEFLKIESNWEDFKKVIAEQEKLPLGFDNEKEVASAEVLVNEYLAKEEKRKQGN